MYEELAGIEVFDQACALVQTDEQLTGQSRKESHV